MRNDITLFLDRMDNILSTDMKQFIIMMINKDVNIKIIQVQKEIKRQMHNELKKVFGTFYNFGGLRLYRNANDQFIVENNIINRNIFMYSRRNNIQNDNESNLETNSAPDNQIVPLQNSSNNNEIVLFNGNQNPQHRIKIYVLYI